MEMSEVRPGPEVPLSLIALLREQTRCRRDELDPNQLGHTGPFSSWQEALTRVARETGLVAESVWSERPDAQGRSGNSWDIAVFERVR